MEVTELWKSHFAVGSFCASPLLLAGFLAEPLGPLCFTPDPKTLTLLFSSPSLCTPLSPPHRFSLTRFLQVSSSSSGLPASATTPIANSFGPQHPSRSSDLCHNRLHLLRCPGTSQVLAFFPTGENSDQLGYVLLSLRSPDSENRGELFVVSKKLNQRIIKIVVHPVDEESGNSDSSGFLMACTMYSVHWFHVKFNLLGREGPVVEYVGSHQFHYNVAHACWSPYLREESVVLLENGELFFFDLSYYLEMHLLNAKLRGDRVGILSTDFGSSGNFLCISVEFSWHPRVLIVARSDAAFLVDMRFGEPQVSCLARIEMLIQTRCVEGDQFLAFSMAGSDGFQFILASTHWLLLCDVRKPLLPVLRWAHGFNSPSFVYVCKLSEMRGNSIDQSYSWATESGHCIIVGSFWASEFGLFCYGPALQVPRTSLGSKVVEYYKPIYAWELPSHFALLGCDCICGSCLFRENLAKENLPEWVDWQQKKEIVLGFGILDGDLSAQLSDPHNFGGFTVIRLLSSGKLELQRFHASWECSKKYDDAHIEASFEFKHALLYMLDDEEYKFPRRFKYLNFDYLNAYLDGDLAKVICSRVRNVKYEWPNENFSEDFHKLLCENFNALGFVSRLSSESIDIFRDISSPTSIRDVAYRKLWSSLPRALLQWAFSSYSEILRVPSDKYGAALEFLVVPEQPQLPPFFLREPSRRSTKWSANVRRGDVLVGPTLPLPVLLTLSSVYKCGSPKLMQEEEQSDAFSPEIEVMHKCNEALMEAQEVAVSSTDLDPYKDYAVSLADDREDVWPASHQRKSFLLQSQKCFPVDFIQGNSTYVDNRHATLICKLFEKLHAPNNGSQVGEEIFFEGLGCIKLKFKYEADKPGVNELNSYKLLNRQFFRWEESFSRYQDFKAEYGLK